MMDVLVEDEETGQISSYIPSKWMCKSYSTEGCDPSTTPESLPQGEPCDPFAPLPTNPDGEEPITGRSDVCPEAFPDSFTSCADYEPGLSCQYGYIYLGCNWNDLSCSPTAFCECDELSDLWYCAAAAIEGCDPATTPGSLPWGEACSP
jgi:hypothetical protein